MRTSTEVGIRIDVNLKDGYEFADARVCYLYDGDGNKIIMDRVTGPETATYSTFTTNYEVPVPEGGMKIDSISRKIAEPVAGEAPETALVALGRIEQRAAHYTVQSVSWTPEVNVFAPGKDYVLTIIYKADEDYGFYADSEFYINDKKMQRSAIQMGKGGWVEVSYRFSLGGQTLQITKEPKDYYGTIGKKASFSVTATGEGLTYEWQVKKATTWSAYTLAGYDTPTFQVSINDKTAKWAYRCVIRDASGHEVATNEVRIKVAE